MPIFDFLKRLFAGKSEKEKFYKIGSRVIIRLSEGDPFFWESKISKVNEDCFFVKFIDLKNENILSLNQFIYIAMPKGEKTAKFKTQIIDISSSFKNIILKLKIPEKVNMVLTYRRVHERLRIQFPIKIKLTNSKKDLWNGGRVTDFCVGGIGLLVQQPYKKNSKIEIDLSNAGYPYFLNGIIKRIHFNEDKQSQNIFHYKVGIQFIKLGARDKERLKKFFIELKRKKNRF